MGDRTEREIFDAAADAYELTDQERAVAWYAKSGRPVKQIAAALSITTHTVKFHFKGLYHKLEVDSRAGMTEILCGQGGGADPAAPKRIAREEDRP